MDILLLAWAIGSARLIDLHEFCEAKPNKAKPSIIW